jgi:hypothetical protein
VKKKDTPYNKYGRTRTAGEISQELIEQDLQTTCAQEQGQQMTKTYVDELLQALQRGKKTWKEDFFIEVLTKRERLLTNIIRNYFVPRTTCPTPNYDQAVYHYIKKDDYLVLLWVLPDRDYAFDLKNNALTLDREYHELLGFILDFADGKLLQKAKILNREDVLEGRIILKEIKND